MAGLELLGSPKLISRKIWKIEKLWHFYTVRQIGCSKRQASIVQAEQEACMMIIDIHLTDIIIQLIQYTCLLEQPKLFLKCILFGIYWDNSHLGIRKIHRLPQTTDPIHRLFIFWLFFKIRKIHRTHRPLN